MKKISSFIIAISLFAFTYAQHSFSIIFDEPDKNIGLNSILEKTDYYLAVGHLTSSSQAYPRIIQISKEGEILLSTNLNCSANVTFNNIYEVDNSYIIVGRNHTNQSLWLIKSDLEFNTIWQQEYVFFGADIIVTNFRSLITPSGNLLVAGAAGTDYFTDENMFTAEINTDGELLRFKTYPLYHNYQTVWDTDALPDGTGYLVSGYHFGNPTGFLRCEVVRLNNKLDIVNIHDVLAENTPWDNLWGNSNIKFYSDTTFLFVSRKYVYGTSTQDEDINIQLLDTAYTLLKETSFGKPNIVEYLTNNQAIDFLYPNSIFVSGDSPAAFEGHNNWSMISKLDEHLDVVWTKFFGGDAFYQTSTLTATTDGGVMLSGVTIPVNATNVDAYILKLDADGNLPAALEEQPNIKVSEQILYPNPGTSELTVRTAVQALGGVFTLRDISGKIIMQQTINEQITSLNTTNLPAGTYLHTYTREGTQTQTGVWVKQ